MIMTLKQEREGTLIDTAEIVRTSAGTLRDLVELALRAGGLTQDVRWFRLAAQLETARRILGEIGS